MNSGTHSGPIFHVLHQESSKWGIPSSGNLQHNTLGHDNKLLKHDSSFF